MVYQYNNVSVSLHVLRQSTALRWMKCLFLHIRALTRNVEEMEEVENLCFEQSGDSASSCKAPRLQLK
jgi:hypothetical protein